MKEYHHLLELFSMHLEKHLATLKTKEPRELYAPEEYILSLGGKRVRPLLALVACELFDKDPSEALNAALSVELFHNFSLIHDDILDAAPLRRNHPTVHVKWNQNIALLSGDVILVKAFQILGAYDKERFIKMFDVFNKTAIQVCEGQQLDMNFENLEKVSVQEYIHMIHYKTAVLLGCSLQMGAIAGNISDADQEHLYSFGKHLGISFQLMDDLLDAFAPNPEDFGKQVGGDIVSNKKTFLLLKAMELANEKQKENLHSLLKSKDAESKIKGILSIYKELNIQQLCEEEANKHTQLAINALAKINAKESKKTELRNFALALLNRQI